MTITFVAAATAVTGVNADLFPTLPAGYTTGDLLLAHVTIRNSGTGTPVTSTSGWTKLCDNANQVLYGKVATSAAETAPAFGWSGSVSDADVSAQCFAFRGTAQAIADVVAASAKQLNGSAQNIAYPALTVLGDGEAVLILGWKQDDSTSVTTPAGYTLIGTQQMTAGSDTLATGFYKIETTAANVSASSITVTGGTSQISRGMVVAFRPAACLAAVEQDTWPARVLLTATGLTPGDTVTLYRSVAGARTAVRGAGPDVVTDPSYVRVDAELPFGIPVTYVALVGSSEYTTAAVTHTLVGGKVAITDAISGQAAEAVISAWPEKRYDVQATVFRAGGRNVVVTDGWAGFSGTIEVYVETTSSTDNLRDVLANATEGVVQIRQPGGYDGVDCYVAVLGAAERRWSQDGSDPRRLWSVSAVEVEGWAPALEAQGFTLQDIADTYNGLTLQDLSDDYATLLAIAVGDFS
jgi:hypothetical protein